MIGDFIDSVDRSALTSVELITRAKERPMKDCWKQERNSKGDPTNTTPKGASILVLADHQVFGSQRTLLPGFFRAGTYVGQTSTGAEL